MEHKHTNGTKGGQSTDGRVYQSLCSPLQICCLCSMPQWRLPFSRYGTETTFPTYLKPATENLAVSIPHSSSTQTHFQSHTINAAPSIMSHTKHRVEQLAKTCLDCKPKPSHGCGCKTTRLIQFLAEILSSWHVCIAGPLSTAIKFLARQLTSTVVAPHQTVVHWFFSVALYCRLHAS